MNIHTVSFGTKIPTMTCKVKNNETGKFVPATLYEYDCSEQADIIEIEQLPNNWGFKKVISNGMLAKKKAREKFDIDTKTYFYALKDETGKTIGISYLYERDNAQAVKFIETDPEKEYKFAGQTMLAGHALATMNDKFDRFEIRFATDEATPFYTHKCGFKRGEDKYSLEMTAKDVKKFLRKIFFRTHGKVKDIRG
ncbi:hypothetical protein IJ425_02575 [bacterium]|nr:hypothetical protein [bacterium]